jgi:nondiscriminating aspartyl-tRNA synthetase
MMVGAFERVFEIAPAFRAEPSATTRHMSEVMMLDIEMGFVNSHDEVLDMVGDMTIHVLRKIYETHTEDLKSLNAPELVLTDKVPKITVAEIHEKYSASTGTDTTKEKDLIPDEEKWISDYARKELGSDLIFATKFPVEAMKFYHQINPEDPTTVLWGDLLFRGLEIATCPLREHHYDKLVEQMKKAGIDVDHQGYKYYLQAFKYGLPQHGGCGFGIDRLVEKTIGLQNVKEATLFPRDINRLAP